MIFCIFKIPNYFFNPKQTQYQAKANPSLPSVIAKINFFLSISFVGYCGISSSLKLITKITRIMNFGIPSVRDRKQSCVKCLFNAEFLDA